MPKLLRGVAGVGLVVQVLNAFWVLGQMGSFSTSLAWASLVWLALGGLIAAVLLRFWALVVEKLEQLFEAANGRWGDRSIGLWTAAGLVALAALFLSLAASNLFEALVIVMPGLMLATFLASLAHVSEMLGEITDALASRLRR